MTNDHSTPGVASGRLSSAQIGSNFSELHPPLSDHEARVAADRCYFCHDAPCMEACPTEIDIPLFIRQIATGRPEAAAHTIFAQNILGGMCARVCPTETLCEKACVREEAEGKPVIIGQLQRHATDRLMAQGGHPYTRAASTGRSVAIVGAGPAGLACAHRLALHGHDVSVFDARAKGGGLNEYGIAAYKAADDFAQKELKWLMGIGGITLEYGMRLGGNLSLETLRKSHDAVFLAVGLAGVNALTIPGTHDADVNAVEWISELRQSRDKTDIPVGRNVVVIGGGMTAVDAAVQARLLGAETVTIAYRRDKAAMAASEFEQILATSKGVRILYNAAPRSLASGSITLARTETRDGKLVETGAEITLPADQVMRAIGQALEGVPDILAVQDGKIQVGEAGRTSVEGIWAGGDCASGGEDLTVTAVAQGRDAAEDIHKNLMGKG
ncbi:glutamate synthase (NADPH/NADH) small chain [Rhodovulum imhoffii]|uniref:Glutamate synthase (NADPH/NADH) small chain n=1 Tax=Rhodovulum imhoffii TaxID=365340 RepID=A0A2T5BQD4_9RHOB|nr:NAD(P)-dependent oxidoreductase [Rhodovulum imhoffii]MBK5933667.1 dihydropyrimidine dehydrogenase [Rhodovulum imhoffii]PTN01353.1 glutamate synthase (NADPH/NADH) small chain [Rhodovulum imhoffii]